MKTKELKELKLKKNEELMKLMDTRKTELVNTTSRIYAGKEKNLKKGNSIRREIAQILTIMSQNTKKELAK